MLNETYRKALAEEINRCMTRSFDVEIGMGDEWQIVAGGETLCTYAIYGSPFWEGCEGIAIDVNTEDGLAVETPYSDASYIPFWVVGDVKKDARRYCRIINSFLEELTILIKEKKP